LPLVTRGSSGHSSYSCKPCYSSHPSPRNDCRDMLFAITCHAVCAQATRYQHHSNHEQVIACRQHLTRFFCSLPTSGLAMACPRRIADDFKYGHSVGRQGRRLGGRKLFMRLRTKTVYPAARQKCSTASSPRSSASPWRRFADGQHPFSRRQSKGRARFALTFLR